jgi:hypothetical protein
MSLKPPSLLALLIASMACWLERQAACAWRIPILPVLALALHFLAGSDSDLRERINSHAGFWNGVLGSLQASAFVALGRIYDDDRGTHSANELLRFVTECPGIFTRAALRDRKVREGYDLLFATQFASKSFVLSTNNFVFLIDAFNAHEFLFIEVT